MDFDAYTERIMKARANVVRSFSPPHFGGEFSTVDGILKEAQRLANTTGYQIRVKAGEQEQIIKPDTNFNQKV